MSDEAAGRLAVSLLARRRLDLVSKRDVILWAEDMTARGLVDEHVIRLACLERSATDGVDSLLEEHCRTLGCADLTEFQCGMLAAAEVMRRMLSGELGIASAEGELLGIVHSAPSAESALWPLLASMSEWEDSPGHRQEDESEIRELAAAYALWGDGMHWRARRSTGGGGPAGAVRGEDETMSIEMLMDGRAEASPGGDFPDIDPLRDPDGMLELQVLDIRCDALRSRAAVIFEARSSFIRGSNTAVLVAHGVDDLAWISPEPRKERRAWVVVGSEVRQEDALLSLEMDLLTTSTLRLRARELVFYAGDVPGFNVPPPDYVTAPEEELHASLPSWRSPFVVHHRSWRGQAHAAPEVDEQEQPPVEEPSATGVFRWFWRRAQNQS